jgi:hypothetical protein
MSIQLTEQQQHELDAAQECPPRVVDPRTDATYVLVRADEYESIREILEDERRQKAIRRVARHNAIGRRNEAP